MDWIEWAKWIGGGLIVVSALASLVIGVLSWFLSYAD